MDTLGAVFYLPTNSQDITWCVDTTTKFLAMNSAVTDSFEEMVEFPLLYKDYYVGKKWYIKPTDTSTYREVVSISETVVVSTETTFTNYIKIQSTYNSVIRG
jgi:hypothetical protein